MSEPTVKLEISDNVALVTLNRPEALNSFTTEMHAALVSVLDQVEADKSVRALVLTGAGRGFCAGQDLNERKRGPNEPPPDLSINLDKYYNPLVKRLYNFPIPTIAAINGVAAGAGANVALACDMLFAARSAKFIQAFSKIGLSPDAGGTWFLPRLVGRAKALGLVLSAESLPAEEAERIGLIWKVVDDDALMETVMKTARKFAQGPTAGYRKIKENFAVSGSNSLDEQLVVERDGQRDLGFTHDYMEGTTSFLEKRKPEFKGE